MEDGNNLEPQLACSPPQPELKLTDRIVAAALAGTLTALVTNPLDVIKTRLQAPPAHSGPSSARAVRHTVQCYVHRPNIPVPVRSTWQTGSSRMGAFQEVLQRAADSVALVRPRPSGHSCLCTAGLQVPLHHCHGPSALLQHVPAPGSQQAAPARSVLPLARAILRQEGMAGLWRGLDSALLMTLPTVVLYYPLYDALMLALSPRTRAPAPAPGGDGATAAHSHSLPHDLGPAAPAVAGALARSVAAIIVSPLELLRTRQQALSAGATTWQALRSSLGLGPGQGPGMVQAEGGLAWRQVLGRLPRLWTGLSATLARDVPFSAVYWGLVEPIRSSLLDPVHLRAEAVHAPPPSHEPVPPSDSSTVPDFAEVHTTDALSQSVSQSSYVQMPNPHSHPHAQLMYANLVAGSLAGTVAAVVTMPFDVVKTRMQVAPMHGPPSASCSSSSSSHDSPGGRGGRHSITSFTGTLRQVYREQGVGGLFVGVGPRVARIAPACAMVIASYELVKATLAKA